jgi:hypothetical protein
MRVLKIGVLKAGPGSPEKRPWLLRNQRTSRSSRRDMSSNDSNISDTFGAMMGPSDVAMTAGAAGSTAAIFWSSFMLGF